MALEINDANFEELVLKSDKPVLVDFWAEWCGPCRLIGPIIDDLSVAYAGKAAIGKVNVDDNPEISTKYGIRSIPTILVIKDGEVVDIQVGVTTKAALEAKILAHLA